MGPFDLTPASSELGFERDLDAIFGRSPVRRPSKGSILGITAAIITIALGGASLHLFRKPETPPVTNRAPTKVRVAKPTPIPPALAAPADRAGATVTSASRRVEIEPVATKHAQAILREAQAESRPARKRGRTSSAHVAAFLAQPTDQPPITPDTDTGSDKHDDRAVRDNEQSKEAQRLARLEALDAVRALRLR